MTDRDALYQAILAHPDEDTPRLAFADYLDETGDPDDTFRADFIRTHCRLAREEPWSPAWRELNARWGPLNARVNALVVAKQLTWVKHLKGRAPAWGFERGLIGHVTVHSKRFVAEGQKFFDQDPIRSVKFVTLTAERGSVKPAELFACPHLARAAKLDFEGSGLADADLDRLAGSPHLAGLRALGLGGGQGFTPKAVPKLLKSLPALTELSFVGNSGFTDRYADELAGCVEFDRVSALNLTHSGVGPVGVRALVGGGNAANLVTLSLVPEMVYDEEHGYPLGARGLRADGIAVAEALAGAVLPNLRELNLNSRSIGDAGLAVLMTAKGLPALRRLSLADNGLTLRGVAALAASPLGRQLLYLNLSFNGEPARKRAEARALFPRAHVEIMDFPA